MKFRKNQKLKDFRTTFVPQNLLAIPADFFPVFLDVVWHLELLVPHRNAIIIINASNLPRRS
jgi:hypothetical protein